MVSRETTDIRTLMIKIQTFACNMLEENCYVVSDETLSCVIIDCGAFFDKDRQAITDYIENKQLKPEHLLVTHGHLDHNFGNNMVYQNYGLKPEIEEHDVSLLNNLPKQAKSFYGMSFEQPSVPIGNILHDGDEVVFGTHRVEVIHTPGHSRGSVSFYIPDEDTLFTGDTLFQMSIGRTDFEGGSMMQIIQSLRRLAQLPDQTAVYPGHGDSTTIGFELQHNPYMDR